MSRIEITQDKRPSSKEFRKMVKQASATSNPLESLLDLVRELHGYEVRRGLTSDEFYRRFKSGELNDELQHCVEWVGAYEAYVDLRSRLEAALVRDAVWRADLAKAAA